MHALFHGLVVSIAAVFAASAHAESYKPGWLVSVRQTGQPIYVATFPRHQVSPLTTVGHERFFNPDSFADFKYDAVLKIKERGNHIFQVRTEGALNHKGGGFSRHKISTAQVVVGLKIASKIIAKKGTDNRGVVDESVFGQIQFDQPGEYAIEVTIDTATDVSGVWCKGTGFKVHLLMREPTELEPHDLTAEDIVYRIKD